MKSKIIVLTEPTAWNFTDETTGQFRSGNSAVCFMPFEGVAQSVSNLPPGVRANTVYFCELGFKQSKGVTGRLTAGLVVNSVDVAGGKPLNWETICK